MNLFDFYYRQLVTQSQMDWVFDEAQNADIAQSTDFEMVGVMSGLDVVQNHLGVDLSVDVLAGAGYNASGQRILNGTTLQNINCAIDEYGVATAVANPANEKYLSVFIRFKRSLQEPAIDGSGLTVYTKQMESYEIVVQQAAEAPIGTASRCAIMSDCLLLADIYLLFGQTIIQTSTHILLDRRQDWVRQAGTHLADFVAGTAKDGVEQLAALFDSWAGGALPFAFTDTWEGAGAVTGFAPPVVDMAGALNAIVFDLASTASPSGAERIGVDAFTSTYVNWTAGDLWATLVNIASAVDGHIGGGAPNHPDTAITAAAKVGVPDSLSTLTVANQIAELLALVNKKMINPDVSLGGANRFRLFHMSNLGLSFWVRGNTVGTAMFEIVYNATYSNGAAQWTPEDAGVGYAAILRIMSGGVIIQTKNSADPRGDWATGWADTTDAWTQYYRVGENIDAGLGPVTYAHAGIMTWGNRVYEECNIGGYAYAAVAGATIWVYCPFNFCSRRGTNPTSVTYVDDVKDSSLKTVYFNSANLVYAASGYGGYVRMRLDFDPAASGDGSFAGRLRFNYT